MPIKSNGYSCNKSNAKLDRKRNEAFNRQDQHESLTIDEKIAKAKSRGGSTKELKRLLKLKVNPPPPVVVAPKAPATNELATEKQPKRKSKKEVIEAAKSKRPSKS